MQDVRKGPADLARRVDSLERSLESAEVDREWDRLEPELLELRQAVRAELAQDRAELRNAEREYRDRYGVLSRINPFDQSRVSFRSTVSRKQYALASAESVAHRLDKTAERFYADKTREHARQFIRIAGKIQRGVFGSWSEKAHAVFGAVTSGQSGEQAIAFAEEAKNAKKQLIEPEGVLLAAAMLSGRGAKEAVEDAEAFSNEAGGGSRGQALAVAMLATGKGRDEARESAEAFKEDHGQSGALIAAAALGSRRSAAEAKRYAEALRGADARIRAAGLLSGLGTEETRAVVERLSPSVMFFGDRAPSVIAAALLSGRDADEALEVVERLKASARGGPSAESTLVAAGLLSSRPLEESAAFVKHVQQALSGTWESESLILAAALLADAPKARAAAFLLPGLFYEIEE